MKIIIIIYILLHLSSVAYAEVYTWEDANGINFSDNPSSMPEERREEALDEPVAQSNTTIPQDRDGITRQKRPVITHEYQPAVYRADRERQRRVLVAIKQLPAGASAVRDRINEETFPSLASLVVTWIVIALFLITVWALTIADIVRSDYITPSTKTSWLLAVFFIPLIGMLLYYISGLSQKVAADNSNEKPPFKAFPGLAK